jgi:hypothetical protein
MTAEPSEGQRRSRGGLSRCSQRPAGGSNHQNEPDDHSGGSCRGGQQNQRMCALVSRISSEKPKEGNWDAIGHRLKHVADHLDPDFSKVSRFFAFVGKNVDLIFARKCLKNELIVVHVLLQNSPNITGLFEVLTTLFATFFDVKSNIVSSNKSQRSKIRERQKT